MVPWSILSEARVRDYFSESHARDRERLLTSRATTRGLLKAKLAKLKRELLTPASSGGPAGAGFDVARTGIASVGFM